MIKILLAALIVTAVISAAIIQFRPTADVLSGNAESSDEKKSYADAGTADIDNGMMKEMDIIINLQAAET